MGNSLTKQMKNKYNTTMQLDLNKYNKIFLVRLTSCTIFIIENSLFRRNSQ